MARFDRASALAESIFLRADPKDTHQVKTEVKREESQNSAETEVKGESDEDDSPPKKKVKRKQDDDAKLAAKLQAQENTRIRSTRGAATKKSVVKKSTPRKKKSAVKVKKADDSDVELNSDGEPKEVVRKGGFHVRSTQDWIWDIFNVPQKPYHLSVPLADLVGEPTVSSTK